MDIQQTQPLTPSPADAISACLCKAEALAAIACGIDLDLFTPEIVSNYLWALIDIIQEGKFLFSQFNIEMSQN